MNQNETFLEYTVRGLSYWRDFLTPQRVIFLIIDLFSIIIVTKVFSFPIGITIGLALFLVFFVKDSFQWVTKKAEHLETHYRFDKTGITITERKSQFYSWDKFQAFSTVPDYTFAVPHAKIVQLLGFTREARPNHIYFISRQGFGIKSNLNLVIRTRPDNHKQVIKFLEQFLSYKLPQNPPAVRYWFWIIYGFLIFIFIAAIILLFFS